MDNNDKSFSKNIKALREKTGLSRVEFCEAMNIPYRTVTEWERGNRTAPEYVFQMIEYFVDLNNICKVEREQIETDRLLIRHFMKEDAKGCLEGWGEDKTLGDYILGYPMNIDSMKSMVQNLSKNLNSWVVILKNENNPIGYITFDIPYVNLGIAEIGYVIGEKYQHKGYAREAIARMLEEYYERKNIYMIEAKYNENNIASSKLLKNIGFKEDAKLRERRIDNKSKGRCDLVVASMTKDEFMDKITGQ